MGVLGILVAVSFFIRLLVDWFGWVPGMVDMFGVAGMRTPAAITVSALILAAIVARREVS